MGSSQSFVSILNMRLTLLRLRRSRKIRGAAIVLLSAGLFWLISPDNRPRPTPGAISRKSLDLRSSAGNLSVDLFSEPMWMFTDFDALLL